MIELDITEDKKLRLKSVFAPVVVENAEGDQIEVQIVNGGFQITRNKDVMIFEKVEV